MKLCEQYGEKLTAFILFNEVSKQNNPMGQYNRLAVFPQWGFESTIRQGGTYLCELEKKGNTYSARPMMELTPSNLSECFPDLVEDMYESFYRMDPERFHSAVTAADIRRIREEEEEKVSKKLKFLEKEVERLKAEQKTKPASVDPAESIVDRTFEGVRDGFYYSPHIGGGYYSLRISYRGSEVLLVEDADGELNGCGGAVDLKRVCSLLDNENVKGEYCPKYGGIVFTKA